MERRNGPSLWPALLAVFALALAIRLAFLFELRASPLLALPFGGAAFFHEWGKEVAEGRAASEVFYHAPLYPYLLGALYRCFGSDPLVARVAQAFLGAAGCALLAYAGGVFFERRVGFLAGLALALYPQAILFDAIHKKTSLALFLLLGFLACLARVQKTPRMAAWLAAGVLLSLFYAARENALVLVPVVLGWIALGFRSTSRAARARWSLAFLIGLSVAPVAMGVRNWRVGGEFIPGTANSGANFYIGNHRGASGLFEPLVSGAGSAPYDAANARRLAESSAGRTLSWRQVSRFWWKRGFEEIAREPFAWLALLAKKAFYLMSAQRWVDDHDLSAFQEESRLLRALGLPLRYGWLAPLGLAGLVFFAKERRLWLLVLCWLALAASLVLFFLVERFRMSLFPFLLLFGAQAACELVRALRGRRWGKAGGIAGLTAVFALAVHAPTGVHEWPHSTTYNFLGLAWNAQGDREQTLRWYERALEVAPENAAAHFNAGAVLLNLEREEEARAHLEQAARLEPAYAASSFAKLGEFHAAHGDLAGALELLERARSLDPLDSTVAYDLGLVLRQLERLDEAEAAYREALRLDPRHVDARNNLGFLLANTGRPEPARQEYERALALDPDFVRARVNLARLLATDERMRDGRAALVHASRAFELAPDDFSVRETLAAAHAASGDYAEALRVAQELKARMDAEGDRAGAARVEEALARYRARKPLDAR